MKLQEISYNVDAGEVRTTLSDGSFRLANPSGQFRAGVASPHPDPSLHGCYRLYLVDGTVHDVDDRTGKLFLTKQEVDDFEEYLVRTRLPAWSLSDLPGVSPDSLKPVLRQV